MSTRDKVKAIKRFRFDLTDYLLHFLKYDANRTAFDTLKKIVTDGYIETGWAIRNGKKTVFGKKPAVCFSEMPLYAHINYVRSCRDIHKVSYYSIALLKEEMYHKGARNVIYGTTNYKTEQVDEDGYYFIDDFPDDEMYRYMLTDIGDKNDWTHEREWRWNNPYNASKSEGLPIWLNNTDNIEQGEKFNFSQIIISVREEQEALELIEILKVLNSDNVKYNKNNIANTLILVLSDNNVPYPPTTPGDYKRLDELVLEDNIFFKI